MNNYNLVDYVSIIKGSTKQTQSLRKFKGDEFWFEWTFLFEDIVKNIEDEIILDGIVMRHKYIPFLYKKFYFTFHTDSTYVYLRFSFSDKNKVAKFPLHEKIGIKFMLDTKDDVLNAVISSTVTDYALPDFINLGSYTKPIRTIGLKSKNKLNKYILIKTILPK